jgi:integrase
MFRRNGVYYAHDNSSGKQQSLCTRDRTEAEKLLHAKNESAQTPRLNRDLGRVYMSACDPEAIKRTWSAAMEEFRTHGRASTQERYERAMRDPAFDGIRDKPIIETTAADLLTCLRSGTNSTNHILRRLHNLVVDLGWLSWPLLAPKLWPKVQWRKKRGITQEEHLRIISTECNPERRLYYELLWETGASQSDAAAFTNANIDWKRRMLWYHRKKLDPDAEPARITIGPRLEALLRQLPCEGPLFPHWGQFLAKDRAAEFRRRCKILKIDGVSLHCYRYAWAERAFENGYPERFAQAALGHASKAIHAAYAKRAKVVCPSLEEYENKLIPQRFQLLQSVGDSFSEPATGNVHLEHNNQTK